MHLKPRHSEENGVLFFHILPSRNDQNVERQDHIIPYGGEETR